MYSGMLGAFLENNEVNLELPENRWYHPSLPAACEWLQEYNPHIASTLRERTELNVPVWPIAMHTDTDTSPITRSEAL